MSEIRNQLRIKDVMRRNLTGTVAVHKSPSKKNLIHLNRMTSLPWLHCRRDLLWI